MAAHVKEKGLADYVTQVDIAVQNFLKKELFALAPDIQFLGEETGLQEIKADCFWILDPVDGTTNLMHDYQHSVVSLALCRQGARFRRVFDQCQDVRRIGSAALELAYTACGRQGGYFEIYLNPWDYAAGMLLIQEAGGQVTDFMGKPLNPRKGSSVTATNGFIHDELLKLLKEKNL